MSSATLSQQVAAALTVDIVSGSIRPGTRLDENSIARRFKVSRTPVRDALRWLAASGLVQFAPRRGCAVMPVERAKVQDAYEAFGEIEALCARLCALRAGLTERERLSTIHDEGQLAATRGDIERYNDINERFHAVIYAGTRNETLEKIAVDLRRQVAQFWSRAFYRKKNSQSLKSSQSEHKALLDAILSRDATAANAAMARHTSRVALSVLDEMDKATGRSRNDEANGPIKSRGGSADRGKSARRTAVRDLVE